MMLAFITGNLDEWAQWDKPAFRVIAPSRMRRSIRRHWACGMQVAFRYY